MSFDITVQGGTSVRLPTAGKYCDRDIVVTSTGGSENLDSVLTEQEALIDELKEVLRVKASGDEKADNIARQFVTATMTTAIFPKDVVTIGQYAYYGQPITGELRLPDSVKTIANNAFNACTKITSIYGSNVTGTATYTFNGMSSLLSVDLPKLATLSMYCLSDAAKLETLILPACSRIANGSLRRCYALKTLDLPSLSYIEQSALQNSSGLAAFILRRNGVCTLANANAFSGTPIASGTGFVYVLADLVDSYKTATNWSTYANQIRAIEDYPEVCEVSV